MIVFKIILLTILAIAAVLAVWYFVTDPMGGPPLKSVDSVDLSQFMGDWYVIANIPTFVEKGATNAVENYSLNSDGSIAVAFSFDDTRPGGDRKRYAASAWVANEVTNAEWRVQFFWPVKFPYYVIELADDYSYTVVGVPNRNYVWIMARTPSLPDDTYGRLLTRIADLGFDTAKVQLVPQVWKSAGVQR